MKSAFFSFFFFYSGGEVVLFRVSLSFLWFVVDGEMRFCFS